MDTLWRWLVTGMTGLAALLLVGCAGELGSSRTGALTDSTASAQIATPDRAPVGAAQLDNPLLHRVADTVPPKEEAAPEEPFDPFAKADEAVGEEYDPWEPFNTKIFEFNRQLDRYILKPVAKGYNFVVPDVVQVGISNIFTNLGVTPRFLNNVFQGKVKGAGIELGRFLLNSTVGIAGFFDPATSMDLVTPEEDFGQTLGFYGVKPGPYLVLPLLPPFNVRDFTGYIGDIFLNPINWLVAPIIEVDGVPSLIAHKNRTTSTFVQLGTRTGNIVNERSRNLEKFQGVEEATLDLYSAVRNAYLQRRAKAVKE